MVGTGRIISNTSTQLLMESLYIIKIGGNIIDDEQQLQLVLRYFAAIEGNKILVHGGGKLATEVAEKAGIPQQMTDGRRITDAETLKVVTMVYAGYINKNIVAQLQSYHCNAFGLSGADGNAVLAHKRAAKNIDYGFAGDIDAVEGHLIQYLLRLGLSVVFSPITHNGLGQLLNTNADTMAQELAKELSNRFAVTLVYCFEKPGVLTDANDDATVIPELTPGLYHSLKEQKAIFDGMIPKLDNAFEAINAGVKKVIIGHANNLAALLNGTAGTIIKDDFIAEPQEEWNKDNIE
jgi:acetylglutamate kinase